MAHATMNFPSDFLWGTATSAYQVEGNNTNSDWWPWEAAEGSILENQRSGRACDWWENAEADLDLAAGLGTNAHRLSLEWSRIEPEPSVFNEAALDRYRQILQAMHDRGIEPMVTLHHFSNPLWLVEKGDFSSDVVVDYFKRYASRVATALGDLVPKWITINEPMVYIFLRYLSADFPPPQRRGTSAARQALPNLLRCHAAAYHAIKEVSPAAMVGVAKNMAVFEPRREGHLLDRWWSTEVSWAFNDWWMLAMQDGRLRWPIRRGRIKHLANTFDFVGINYYTRYYMRFLHGLEREWPAGAVISDGDYGELYPAGLFRVIKHVMRYQKPILITENGLPDKADKLRSAFLLTHLREVWRAVNFNWPVMGYYHWTLTDNFEWDRGWTQRFGLYSLDPETQERRLRRSGQLYQEICQTGSLSSTMAEQFAPSVMRQLFPG